MPHLTIEYSGNLDHVVDIEAACRGLHEVMAATGMFPLAGIRVRAVRAGHHVTADRLAENAFAHMILRIGMGRTLDAKKQAGQQIMTRARELFAAPLATAHFALSLEMVEINAELSWKVNPMHDRIAAGTG